MKTNREQGGGEKLQESDAYRERTVFVSVINGKKNKISEKLIEADFYDCVLVLMAGS